MNDPVAPEPGARTEETSVLVLFSGGLDSTVALTMATHQFSRVVAVLFDYGQQSRIELDRARRIARLLRVELVEVPLDLSAWGGSSLFGTERRSVIPENAYVPARNLILLSVAAGIAEARDLDCIWTGTNASERTFADQSPEFFAAVRAVFDVGLRRSRHGRPLRIGTPLSAITKDAVVRAGVNVDAPLYLSWSCYGDGPIPCGGCLSCEQRRDAFAVVGLDDPADSIPIGCSGTDDTEPCSVVQIVGTLHSGSTVLSLMLEAHPDVAAVGELFDLRTDVEHRLPCSCGFPIDRCGFWATVLDPWSTDADSLDGSALDHASLEAVERLPEGRHDYAADATHLLDRVVASARRRVIVDSSKHIARFDALRRVRPIKALHLVRDGRAHLDSMRRAGEATTAEAAARRWASHHGRAAALADQLGDDYLLVRYEDLCTDPTTTLVRVWSWLGLEPPDEIADWTEVRSHHVRGNRVRFDRRPLELDDGWRHRLVDDDVEVFRRIAGAELSCFGYDPDTV